MNLKRYILSFLLLSTINICAQFNNNNIDFLGHLSYDIELNDIWGFVGSDSNEYALVGTREGFSIVDVNDSENLNEIWNIAGNYTIWRDVKEYQNYAYVVNDNGNQGILIVDMNNIPDTTMMRYKYWQDTSYTAHNVFIENGFMYLFGTPYANGGALIYSLEDPWNPSLIGEVDFAYIHDGTVRNDTLWAANINDGYFSIIDVSDKSNPILLAEASTPYNFTHNCWPNDDGKYVFTTDERPGAPVAAYNISNYNRINLVDEYRTSQSNEVIPHNTIYKDGFLLTSYYRDGLTITDVHHPEAMVEVGYFDTSPEFEGDGYNGAWGIYPFLPSGNILISDIETGLYVLKFKEYRASHIDIQVFNVIDSNTIPLVDVYEDDQLLLETDISGHVLEGFAFTDTFDVIIEKDGYQLDTIRFQLANGKIDSHLVYLVPDSLPACYPCVEDNKDSIIDSIPTMINSIAYQISIFPNPATDHIYIKSDQVINSIEVLDLTGRLVQSSVIDLKETSISTNHLEKGIYILNVFCGQTRMTQKIILA